MEQTNGDQEEQLSYEESQLFDLRIVSVKEAASILRVSPKTIYRNVRLGTIPYKRVGGQIRFYMPDLLEWLRGE